MLCIKFTSTAASMSIWDLAPLACPSRTEQSFFQFTGSIPLPTSLYLYHILD